MRDYGVVHTKFWTEDDVQSLSDGAQLLFLYLLTGPHTTAAGCFRLPLAYISADRKWNTETVSERFAELSQNGFAYRCEKTEWVIIPKFLKHNPIPNPNCGLAVAKTLDSLPKTFSYLPLLISMLEPFENRMPNGFMNGLRNRLPNGMPNQDQDQEQEQEQEEETPSLRSGVGAVQPGVEPALLLPLPQPKVFITIPVNGDKEHSVTEADVAEYQALYGNVNVEMHLRKMRGHWSALPKNQRKTAKGIRKSINTWLAKEQDRACAPSPSRDGPAPRTYQDHQREERRETAKGLMRAMGMTGGKNAGVDEARSVGGDAVLQPATGELLPKVPGGIGRA